MALGTKSKDGVKGKAAEDARLSRPRPGMADFIAGEARDFQSTFYPYLPHDLVGGSVPHIPGTEEEAVWNAASQACGTEKIHFCYAVDGGRVWYLACPSASLASNPDSWCPLAAALPGNSEYWDRETVYLYEQEGMASAMRWDPETGRMQVFLGASRTILPRIQSMDANFVTVNPEVAEIVPWKNINLKTEKLARATARFLVYSGMLVGAVALVILIFNYISISLIDRNLKEVKKETDQAAMDLMMKAASVMKSDTAKHFVRVQELLDQLARVNGTLVKYQVTGEAVTWEALIPEAFAKEFGGVQVLEIQKDGRVRIKSDKM